MTYHHSSYATSNDSQHVAVAIREGSKTVVFRDGRRTNEYEEASQLLYSPDGEHLAYSAKKDGMYFLVVDDREGEKHKEWIQYYSITFSPDGSRVAYIAQGESDSLAYLGVDGSIDRRFLVSGRPVFSPDGKSIGYRASDEEKSFIVINGVPGPKYSIVSGPFFSPDSKRVAYVVDRLKFGGKTSGCMVVDGTRGRLYDGVGEPEWSPDGNGLTFSAHEGEFGVIVQDGREGSWRHSVSSPTYSPDSMRMGFYATDAKGKVMAFVDGKEAGPAFGEIVGHRILFSPDSKRYAFEARNGTREFVVVDGQREKTYDHIGSNTLTFSPNSQRVAYCAMSGQKWFAVVDGKDGPKQDIDQVNKTRSWGPIVFSRDSKRYAYAAVRRIVIDGEYGPEFDAVNTPVFSPDGADVAYQGFKKGKPHLVVNKAIVASYDKLLSCVAWDADGTLRLIAGKTGAICRIEVKPAK